MEGFSVPPRARLSSLRREWQWQHARGSIAGCPSIPPFKASTTTSRTPPYKTPRRRGRGSVRPSLVGLLPRAARTIGGGRGPRGEALGGNHERSCDRWPVHTTAQNDPAPAGPHNSYAGPAKVYIIPPPVVSGPPPLAPPRPPFQPPSFFSDITSQSYDA